MLSFVKLRFSPDWRKMFLPKSLSHVLSVSQTLDLILAQFWVTYVPDASFLHIASTRGFQESSESLMMPRSFVDSFISRLGKYTGNKSIFVLLFCVLVLVRILKFFSHLRQNYYLSNIFLVWIECCFEQVGFCYCCIVTGSSRK